MHELFVVTQKKLNSIEFQNFLSRGVNLAILFYSSLHTIKAHGHKTHKNTGNIPTSLATVLFGFRKCTGWFYKEKAGVVVAAVVGVGV